MEFVILLISIIVGFLLLACYVVIMSRLCTPQAVKDSIKIFHVEIALSYRIFWNEIVPEIYEYWQNNVPLTEQCRLGGKIGVYSERFDRYGKELYQGRTPDVEAMVRARKFLKEQGRTLYCGYYWQAKSGSGEMTPSAIALSQDPYAAHRSLYVNPNAKYNPMYCSDITSSLSMPDIRYKSWLIQSPPVNDFHRSQFKYSDGSIGQLRPCPDQYGFPSYPFHPSYEKLPPVRPPADNSAKEKTAEPVRKSSASANKASPASREIPSASVNVAAAPAAQQGSPATQEDILSNLYSNYSALCNEATQEAQDAFLASMNAALAAGLITLEWGGPSFGSDSFSANDGLGELEDHDKFDPLVEQDVFDDPSEPDAFDEFGNPVKFNEFGEAVPCEDLFDPPQEEDFGEEMLEQEFFDAILDGRIWDEDYF